MGENPLREYEKEDNTIVNVVKNEEYFMNTRLVID
jgi:hypothetical protein